MPHLLPAAASAIAAAAPAAASTAAATAAKAGFMATLKSVAFNALTNLAISAAMSVLQPQVGGQSGRTFEFVIDPDGPIPFAAGRVGVAGSVIHRDTFGPDLMYYGIPFVLSGAGPITAIESFMADDYPMSFDANGGATTEPYRQELFFRSVLGHQPAPAALTTPSGLKNGAALPGWTSAHKLSGKAAGLIVMAENSKGSAFPTGEIKPLIQMLGLKGWDPTLDSTYPGGSGPCRLSDPSTWVTLTCPILWGLKWSLGLWEGPNGKGAPQVDHQVGGIGAKLSGIDVPAFVAASNIAKANGWTVSAYPNTDDDKHQVLEAFLQAGGAIYSQRAGKISCISRAAPRTSIVTISAADTAGPLEIDTAASRIDRINTIRPRFWSPAHRWQMTAMEEVTAASYQTEDGGKRTRGIDYPFVSNAKQAGQLAALQIANTREGIAGVIPLKPHLQRIRPGDAFTITEPGFVLNGLKCLCLNTDYDPATGVVRVSFVSETDAKYPFALGQDPTPPEPQVLTPVDPGYVTPPLPGDWTIVPRPPAPGGSQLPGFDLGGVVSNDTADSVIVEHGPSSTGPWKQAYEGPPNVTNIPIDGLQPGATYYVAVRYRRGNNYSERYVYGPYTAPALVAGDVAPTAPSLLELEGRINDAFGGQIDGVEGQIAQVRSDLDGAVAGVAIDLDVAEAALQAQGAEIAAARGGSASVGARIGLVEQARADGDDALAQSIVGLSARTEASEADILTLFEAQVSEAEIRAQADQRLEARSVARSNRVPDGGLTKGADGWTLSQCSWANDQLRGPVITSTAASFSARSPQFAVLGGATETISLTVENQRTGGAPVVLLRYWDAAGQAIVPDSPTTLLSASGRRQSVLTHPVNAVRAAFIVQDAGGAGYFDFGLAMINPGSEAAPFVDSETSVSFAVTLIDHQEVLVQLESGKASAEDLQQISVDLSGLNGEVSAVVGRLDQAEGDLQGKASASALEEVEARTATAKAAVIDLEIALATEVGARADAINQLSARQAVRPNHVPNGGMVDSARGWLLNGGAAGVVNPVRGRVITANSVNWSALSAPFPVFGGETYFVGASLLSQRNGGWMGVRLRYYSDAAAQVDGPGQSIANGAEIAGSGEERKSIGSVAPSDAILARAEVYAYAGSGGYSDVGMVMVNAGTVAAPFNDLTTAAEISASVTEQSLAIIDLENQQALASYQLIASATGGKPARFALVSSTAGSYVAIDAPYIFWGDNTVFDDATDTLQTTIGPNIRVLAFGAPFGAQGNLLEWWGPSSTAFGDMTTGNGLNGRMTTAPYVFDNVIGGGRTGGARSFSSGPGGTSAASTVPNVLSGSLIEMSGALNGGSLNADAPLYGTLFLYETSSAGKSQVYSEAVTVESDGLVFPDGSFGAQGASIASPRQFAARAGNVTYSVSFTRTGGSSYVNGATLSGGVIITPPA